VTATALLEVADLRVAFTTDEGTVQAVSGVSFSVSAGEVLAIVGESGCGKSATVLTLLGLTRSANATIAGSVLFEGHELLNAPEDRLRPVRGARIAMVFQDPMTALNPVHRVGDQVAEQIRAHDRTATRPEAHARALAAMERARIPDVGRVERAYPHELSGGTRQRVVIAMALSCGPSLLIADEPTTALDVTIQAQILAELSSLRTDDGMAMILVTHDLGVVADIADRVAVMYAGEIVEEGALDDLFYDPQHPYTWGLLGSIARVDVDRPERLPAISGAPPSLLNPPEGCHFRPRCPHRFATCTQVPPLTVRVGADRSHRDRCWLAPEEKRVMRRVDGHIGLSAGGW
jgi:oligopeptide/dipeptide ABC transporter ATP-binding protein